MKVYFTQYTKM